MNAGMVLLGLITAAVVIPNLVSRLVDRWFKDVESMDHDYPRDGTDTSWPAGGISPPQGL